MEKEEYSDKEVKRLNNNLKELENAYIQKAEVIMKIHEENKQLRKGKKLLAKAFNEIYFLKTYDTNMSYDELEQAVGRLNSRIIYLEKQKADFIKKLEELKNKAKGITYYGIWLEITGLIKSLKEDTRK